MKETGRRVEILCYVAQNLVSPLCDISNKDFNRWTGCEFTNFCAFQKTHNDEECISYLREQICILPDWVQAIWEIKINLFKDFLKTLK